MGRRTSLKATPLPPPQTVAELMDRLGGNVVVARYLDIVPSAVSNARRANRIHEHWKWKLARLCDERGVEGYAYLFDKELLTAPEPQQPD